MPPRKRNKGRTRKAKAKAKSNASDAKLSHLIENLSLEELAKCRHGAEEVPEACQSFMNTFYQEWLRDLGARREDAADDTPPITLAVATTLMQFPQVWKDGARLEAVKSTLVAHGTEMLLRHDSNKDAALDLACAMIAMDNYDPDTFFPGASPLRRPLSDEEYMKNRDISQGCERSLVRFYSKRIPCSCLDEKYEALKSQRKTGLCGHCEHRKERGRLMLCSRCNRQQYCSRECQVAHWSIHKEECKKWCGK